MPYSPSPIQDQQESKQRTSSSSTTSSTTLVNDNAKSKTLNQDQSKQPSSDYYGTSSNNNNSSDTQSQQTPATMSSTTSTRSPAPSTRDSSSFSISSGESKRPLIADPRRSSVERAMDKAKNKLQRSPKGSETLPNDELDHERQRAKAVERQRRKEEYERLGLSEKTKYGSGGFSFSG